MCYYVEHLQITGVIADFMWKCISIGFKGPLLDTFQIKLLKKKAAYSKNTSCDSQ